MSTYQPVSRKAGTGSASVRSVFFRHEPALVLTLRAETKVFSRVFGRNRQDAKLPRFPQSKQVDQHNAEQYVSSACALGFIGNSC